jgi:hypothetical protein
LGLVSLILSICTSCSVKNQVEAEYKKLDSLSIVLNTKLTELNKCDTALLLRAITKFTNYAVFIENNLSDTITKTQANGLQQLYVSGNNLKAFAVNRINIRSRANLVIEQVRKLNSDLENGLITKADYLKNFDAESKAMLQLITYCDNETKNFNSNIQDFKNAISPVEMLIKSRNNGLLPEAIKDSINI